MADKKVSELLEATSAGVADVFLIVTGGLSKRITKTNLFKLMESLDVVGLTTIWKTHETLSNSGAVSTSVHTTFLNNGNTGVVTFSLGAAAGGTTKIITCTGNLGIINLSIVGGLGVSAVTFAGVGSSITLHFVNGSWVVIGSHNVTIS